MNLANMKQFVDVPNDYSLVVSGPCNSGRTVFACLAAASALDAGQRVAYIDPTHSEKKRVFSYHLANLLGHPSSKLQYLSLPDVGLYTPPDLIATAARLARDGYFVVLDDLNLAIARAAQTLKSYPLARVFDDFVSAVAATKHSRFLVCITTKREEPTDQGTKLLTSGVDTEKNDPLPGCPTRYPIVVKCDDEKKVCLVELKQIRQGYVL